MQTADVIEFPTADTIDLEEVHVRAATLDFLAELVEAVATDGYIAVDRDLSEQLRTSADVLLELSDAVEVDAVTIRSRLAASADLIRRATVPISHSSARRMFGGALYERVRPVVMVLGELSSLAYERSLDANPDALVEQLPIRRFGRVAAHAYDWAQWNADAPPHLRATLIDALGDAATRAASQAVDRDGLAPIDAAPLMDALETLFDTWLATSPADQLADYAAERDPDLNFGDCFDLGVACSIARRLLVTTGEALPDSADVHDWLEAAQGRWQNGRSSQHVPTA